MAQTTGERLARIETILEGMAKDEQAFRAEVREALKEIKQEAKQHREKTDADEAALQALKNKGSGILIGVALASSAATAAILKGLQSLFN